MASEASVQIVKFTPEQDRAINNLKGHLRIMACPGSGKTEVVSQRIVRLIEGGADPKTIVAFTFTEKAADELKARTRSILQARDPKRADFGDMFVGTIHSFCRFMLKELGSEFRSFDVLTDAMRVAFVSKGMNFFNRLGLRQLKDRDGLRQYQTINKFLASCDIMMIEDIDPRKLSDKEFAVCYNKYRELLIEEKYFDFSSVMYSLVKAAKSDKFRRRLAERVKHVVVDEYQDVDRIQEMLIEILSESAQSVCVVGDDDQNIFHWRGSDVSIIRSFGERYGRKYKVSDVHLSTNFRSTNAVISTAKSFIRHNKERLEKDMVPSPELLRKYEEGDIVCNHFQSDQDELHFIGGKISELLRSDFLDKKNRPFSLSYADFAVLVRTNDDAAKVVAFLDTAGVPCIAYSGTSVFERPEVLLAMNCIAYLFKCERYPDFDAGVPDLGYLQELYASVFLKSRFPLANSHKFRTRLEAVKKDICAISRKSPKDYFGDLGLQGFYFRILGSFGANDFDFGDTINFNLAALSRAISDYESVWVRLRTGEVKWFFPFVHAFARGHYTETQHEDVSLVNAVSVLTIHKAKGLEFPVVFVPGLEQRRSGRNELSFVDRGLYDADKYEGTTEDERRVYYTAMTRSEKYLFLTGSEHHEGRKKEYQPHPFVEEIDHKYFAGPAKLKRSRSGYPPKLRMKGIYPSSFSQLNAYDRCPQDFEFRHVYQYNAGVPVTFGYGTNVHNALNVIHADYLRVGKVPSDQKLDRMVDRMFKLRYATEKIAARMKKKATDVVKNYVHLHEDGFKRILETEKRFEFAIDEALISGQIDLIKKLDRKGRVTEVEVIDFKTDRNDSVYNADYDKQLKFYAIACLESLGLKPKGAYIHHLDEDTKTYVDISDPVLDTTKQGVREDVAKILKKNFTAKPAKALCVECDYKAICSKRVF